jgi:hypothetical protein
MNEVMEGISVIIGYSCGGVYNFVDFGLPQYDNVTILCIQYLEIFFEVIKKRF